MKRFIDSDELARDSRFIRQRNIAASILSKLPDDVDAIVETFENLESVMEEGVRGTAAEPLFDEYGVAFALITTNEPLRPGDPGEETRLKMRLHGIFVGELQALEGAGRSLWDFPDAPWEFKMNMARQVWDEARHCQIYEKLLQHAGGDVGMFGESTFLFEACCSDDPAMRVAGVNRGLEGLACDVFRDMLVYSEKTGDEVMHQAVDYVLADELTHVRFGSNWVREFTKGDPEHLKRTQDFRREVDRRFNFGGARSNDKDAAIPIAWDDRIEAGFTEEELEDLVRLGGEGPSRKTLRAASDLLVRRWRERKGLPPVERATL
ncbi:MAG: ferritin-like domain-containing protein [Myxococcota bacterium]